MPVQKQNTKFKSNFKKISDKAERKHFAYYMLENGKQSCIAEGIKVDEKAWKSIVLDSKKHTLIYKEF